MQKNNIAALGLCAVVLAGCADGIAAVDAGKPLVPGSASGASNAAIAKAGPVVITAEQRNAAICEWAKTVGLNSLTVGRFDAGATKREIAKIDGAYRATCPAQPAPTASPPAVPTLKAAANANK